MNRTATLTLAALAAATVAAPGAVAAPPKPKPITKTYTATAPMPDPTNWAGQGYSVCAMNVPQSYHIEEFKAPAAGTLKVTLSKFEGDWDSLLLNDKGDEMTYGGSSDVAGEEVMQMKFKKAQTVQIIVCNWAGGPTGEVTYTFTFKS